MEYFYVEPEIAGSLGENTVMDTEVHPPAISHLHYEFEGWLGDVVLESFPAFIVTQEAADTIRRNDATGGDFAEVEISTSEEFEELYPDRSLPAFVRLLPRGVAGRDDIGAADDGRLVLSERILVPLQELGIANALIEPFDG